MPMKHAKKRYIEGGIYHVYNRGVNKECIFTTSKEYAIFIALLRRYLLGEDSLGRSDKEYKNYKSRIKLLAFCLMENHFHLLLKQQDKTAISEFMHNLSVSYTLIINKRNDRVGHLFQGVYKARSVLSLKDMADVSRYIHLNPSELGKNPFKYRFSSIRNFVDSKRWGFVNENEIMTLFGNSQSLYLSYLQSKLDLESEGNQK